MRAYLELLRTFIGRGLRRDGVRSVLTVCGIALGVTVIVGIRLANRSALASFRAGTEAVAGRTSLSIAGNGASFDELLLRDLGWLGELGTASPVIDGRGFVADAPGSEEGVLVRILGIDILRDRPIRDWRLLRTGKGEEGKDGDDQETSRGILDLLIDSNAVIVPQALAVERGVGIGDSLPVTIDDRVVELRVRGLLADEGPARAIGSQVLLMDIAGAQLAFGMLGRLHRIDLRLASDRKIEDAKRRIEARLPPELHVEEPANAYRRVESMIESFHFNLNALASLALLVGLYLVYDTARFSVVRRRSEIGRLRAVGATQRLVLALFLGEAFILALPGTALGCAAGAALAREAVRATAGTVRTFWVADAALESTTDLVPGAVDFAIAFGVALPLCLLAALLPALEATRVRPWEAIRASSPPAARAVLRPLAASLVLALAGFALSEGPPIRGLPVLGYLAVLLFVLSGSFLIPPVLTGACGVLALAARVFRPLGAIGTLAAANLRGAVPKVSVAMAALAASLAMTVAIAILVGSFRRTVVYWLEQVMCADIYAKPATLFGSLSEGTISPEAMDALQNDPDVALVIPRFRLDIEFRGEAATFIARDLPSLASRGGLLLAEPRDTARAIDNAVRRGGVLLSESFARRHDIGVGDPLPLRARTGIETFEVDGIYYDYATHRGVVLADTSTWERSFATPERSGRPSDVSIWVRDGADPDAVAARLRRRFSGEQPLFFRTNAGVLESSLEIFDGTFAITGALQAIAVTVAAFAVVSTLLTLLIERRREIALLVQCGASPRQVRGVIVLESALLGVASQVVGVLLGAVLALVLVYVINVQSFGWTIQWHTPWEWIAESSLLTVLATAVAGVFPARQATRRGGRGGIRLGRTLFATVAVVVAGVLGTFTAIGPMSRARAAEDPGTEAEAASWREAVPGHALEFPRDHGPHRDYKIEWWYWTGNLETEDGERFGYQLTFFRTGVVREPSNPSRFAVRDLHLAHFAVSSIDDEEFRSFEKINRRGISWADETLDAKTGRVEIFNEDWKATIDRNTHTLRASAKGRAIELELEALKPPVLHGRGGYSQKGSDAGNASYYYSLSRLETTGHLTVDGRTLAVRGTSWMDHEFGTSFLEREQVGWDWLSLQLEDGRELMLFRLRRRDGELDPRSSGTWVEVDGTTRPIRAGTFSLEPTGETWRSPASSAPYPTRWRVAIAALDLELTVEAAFPSQELSTPESTGLSYWEGSVRTTGTIGGVSVRGRGYLEMTGYAGKRMGEVFR